MISLFWKWCGVPVGHLQLAAFPNWYWQRGAAAEVQKPLPQWLGCVFWGDLLFFRCSSWSFSPLLAYKSCNILWLTGCTVFPVPVPCKNGPCRQRSCQPWGIITLRGLELLAWVLEAQRTGSSSQEGRSWSCIWRWRDPCPTARDILCWGQGTFLQATCMHLIIPLSSLLSFWQCEGATWMETDVWFLLRRQHCFEKGCSGGCCLFVTWGWHLSREMSPHTWSPAGARTLKLVLFSL